ncbi:hypothetical protein AB0D49_40675 [Streptomyces sp. NPDC048290]|uniref:hypothetical protein n=1 Tax=Streptomyces sp. NPDC048290 TaxID=3155811 RepID=UPI003426687B
MAIPSESTASAASTTTLSFRMDTRAPALPGARACGVPTPARTFLLRPPAPWAGGPADGDAPEALIVDLYDGEQDAAGHDPGAVRAAALNLLRSPAAARLAPQIWLRVRPLLWPGWRADLEALGHFADGVVVPETTTVAQITEVAAHCPGLPVMPVLRAGLSASAVARIAEHPRVVRLAFAYPRPGGSAERFTQDARRRANTLLWGRSVLPAASRAAGLPGPVNALGGPPEDAAAMMHDATLALTAGYTGQCVRDSRLLSLTRSLQRHADLD